MSGALGDRMKAYEAVEAKRRLMPLLPAIARLDGKCFSRFTRGLARPYDERLSQLMAHATEFLVQETGARAGYTQSDEISLLFHSDVCGSQIFMDGRVAKMTSILAAMASAKFSGLLPTCIPERAGYLALFDCRVWSVPTREEAANVFLWRELDATKNSISMAAREHYSHKQLQGRKSAEMQELLWQKGVNWNDYPTFFKRGTFFCRRVRETSFGAEEIEQLPPRHKARENPDLKITRSVVERVEMPPFSQVTNRAAALFDGADPCVGEGDA